MSPHKCPVCDGTGLVSRPPHIAGDINIWTYSNAGPFTCKACLGTGVLWAPDKDEIPTVSIAGEKGIAP